jgi:nicotinamidase-related amidase
MDKLDPARTALVLVHMVKGVAGLFRTLVGCNCLLEGTPAVEIIDDLAPRPGEPLVRGQATSGFDRTELDSILRVAGVDTLVVAGIATDVAVESTARTAGDLQYRTIVVSDGCVADTDEGDANSLAVFKKWFGETPTAAEILAALK